MCIYIYISTHTLAIYIYKGISEACCLLRAFSLNFFDLILCGGSQRPGFCKANQPLLLLNPLVLRSAKKPETYCENGVKTREHCLRFGGDPNIPRLNKRRETPTRTVKTRENTVSLESRLPGSSCRIAHVNSRLFTVLRQPPCFTRQMGLPPWFFGWLGV